MKKFLLLLLMPLCAKSQDYNELREKAFKYALGRDQHITEWSFMEIKRDSIDLAIREALPTLKEMKKGDGVFMEFVSNGRGEIIQLKFMVRGTVDLEPKDYALLEKRLRAHKIAAVVEKYRDYEMLPPMSIALFSWKP